MIKSDRKKKKKNQKEREREDKRVFRNKSISENKNIF